MEQNDIGCFSFLKMLVLNWNSHPCLMYVLSKSKVTQNISNLQAWHKNMQNGKSLFMWRHSLWGKKNPKKPAKNENTGLVVILWSCFIRRPPVQEDHFWVFSRVVVLYRLDCISELEYACGYLNTSQFYGISIQKTSRVQISFIWILEYHWLT